ncbi:Acriflavine resistance protein A precursor [Kingella potus]|uniref:Acriflavine resistance protein A n=1 Tax=Kingella potus TaxID=265175 RepID=A0A377R382_9NEIS|nr:efflux RND transporter periplasmic adaptor subunit [Kingella potus]STR02956.1 Acriflavine resistance protein A precursor [Kingella potus]
MTRRTWHLAASAAAVSLALAACGGQGGAAAEGGQGAAQEGGAAAQQQPPAPAVEVVTVQPQDVALTVELPGRLEAVRSAAVRPQVGGIVKRRLFQEGTFVREGQPLYQLEDASYTASLESARAQLASAEAALAKANADVSRYRPLVEADAISKQEFDAAISAKRSADASVKAAKAAIRSAQINVNYSRVSAPISGFIGQSNVSEGALVSSGDATAMATITQTDPMYANVTQSAVEIMKLRRQISEGKMAAANGRIEVDILLEDGSAYAHKGQLMFADPTVSETTGQVKLRVVVPNPENVLLPNLYVRAVMSQSAVPNAFVVPQQAVTRGAKDTVMVVNAQSELEPRVVSVAAQQGGNWIVSDGLKAGDRVVVAGTTIAAMMGAQTGSKKVAPKEWVRPSENAAAPAAAAQAAEQNASAPQQAASAAQPGVQTASEAGSASAASAAK